MRYLFCFVVIPLAAALFIALLGRRIKNISDILCVLATACLLTLSLHLAQLVSLHKIIIYKMAHLPLLMGISLVADGLASFMLITLNLICLFAAVYAISYMKLYSDKWKFGSLFMLMLAGLNGVIISGDIFNLYVFLEVASISGYALVAFGTEPEDLEAAFKYAIMGSLASIFVLLGIALLYSYTSTLNMADISYCLSLKPKGKLIGFISVLFLAGFGLKSALVPFHAWLADAHSSAPTPVSAMLSGVFIKIAGIYALARVFFNVIGTSDKLLFVLMSLGIISMVVGAFLAVAQSDIKRMFAYSSISQVGYIVFALGIGTPLAILGGLFHLFNHALFKSLLFFNAGAIEYSTGTRSLNKLSGLNSKLPVTGASSLVGSMSISGIPPLGGFWSKLIIIIAAIQAGYFAFAIIAAVISIVTLVYYLKFQSFAFFGKLDSALSKIKEVPLTMKLTMISLALLCILSGLLVIPACRPFLQSATDALLAGTGYKEAVLNIIR